MTESEGSGIGRCVTVLMGGRSGMCISRRGNAIMEPVLMMCVDLGGHQAAVLGAAFHPALPVVATCGVRASGLLIPN